MLPLEAQSYFDSLWSSASANVLTQLSQRIKEFERTEFARGQSPGNVGFSARISVLYKNALFDSAQKITDTLQTVHKSFDSPINDGIDAQLKDWGARALSNAYQGLEGAYTRHLQAFGVQLVHASGLDQAYIQTQASVANSLQQYLWQLRNVPALKPQRQNPPPHMQVTINNNNSGPIGAIQVGAGSTANVQQHWSSGDTSELKLALVALREAFEHAHDIDSETRSELVADIDSTCAELERETPNKGKVLRWLGGIGAAIGTIGSVQPAYEAVRSLARMLGLPL